MTSLFAPRLLAVALAALIAGGIGTTPNAEAAGSNDQQAQSQSQQATPDFSEAKLEAFTVAAVEVSTVLREWGPKVKKAQNAGDTEKAQKLAGEVRGKAKAAIQETDGITLAEYNQIAKAARNDQALNKKLTKMVRDRQGQQGGQSQ